MNRSPGSLNSNWAGGMVKLNCVRCDKPFEVIPSRKQKAKYCTLRCFNEFQKESGIDWFELKHGSKIQTTGLKGKRRKEYVKKECRWCKTTFEIAPGSVAVKHFCSPACSKAWRSWRSSAERSPTWKGGIAKHPYPFNWVSISADVMNRDGHCCQNPKCPALKKRYDVHHIDYEKTNCAAANLITLCDSCHSEANFNRDYWADYYSTIQSAKGISIEQIGPPRMRKMIGWNRGCLHPLSKVTEEQVLEIRSSPKIRGTNRMLAKKMNVSEALISVIKSGKIRNTYQ